MPKEYTYNVVDVTTGKMAGKDITLAEILLIVGKNVNLGPCIRYGSLIDDRYRVEYCREFERLNAKEYGLYAQIEMECRKFRGLKWSKTDGFDLAGAWRRWKKQQAEELRWIK